MSAAGDMLPRHSREEGVVALEKNVSVSKLESEIRDLLEEDAPAFRRAIREMLIAKHPGMWKLVLARVWPEEPPKQAAADGGNGQAGSLQFSWKSSGAPPSEITKQVVETLTGADSDEIEIPEVIEVSP